MGSASRNAAANNPCLHGFTRITKISSARQVSEATAQSLMKFRKSTFSRGFTGRYLWIKTLDLVN